MSMVPLAPAAVSTIPPNSGGQMGATTAGIATQRIVERFLTKVAYREDGCWEWLAAKAGKGYGVFRYDGRQGYAHRFAYEHYIGPIPEGLQIDHLCRNKECVNPEHMEPVTGRVNVLRSPTAPTAINARKTHCVHGHSLVDAYKDRSQRKCRTCHLKRMNDAHRRKKAAV